MYTTLVLVAGKMLRGYFAGSALKIMFDDMPNVDRIMQVRWCSGFAHIQRYLGHLKRKAGPASHTRQPITVDLAPGSQSPSVSCTVANHRQFHVRQPITVNLVYGSQSPSISCTVANHRRSRARQPITVDLVHGQPITIEQPDGDWLRGARC